MDRDETGKDGVLIVNSKEFAFTNVEKNIEWGETGSDYNDKQHVHHRKTNKDSSGTIEVEGSEADLKSAIMDPNGKQREDIRISMKGSEEGDRFTGVTITSFNREFPGGDVTTTSVDWVANSHRPVSGAELSDIDAP
jgi:hypothetical protein